MYRVLLEKMITLGEKQVFDTHGFDFERSLVLKNGVPVILPVDSFVASQITVNVRGVVQENIQRVKLVIHNENVLTLLQEVDAEMSIHFVTAPAYQQLLMRDNCLITRSEHTLLKKNERLFVELFVTNSTTKLRLRIQGISPYAEKLLLAQNIPVFDWQIPEMNDEIFRCLLRLFWI